MGYDFHITRAESWPESMDDPIEQAEWEELASSSKLLFEEGHVDWLDIGQQKIYAVPGESASFSWRLGRIDISGYLSDRVRQVAETLSHALGACLYGDDE